MLIYITRIFNKHISFFESFKVTAYSGIINFFGFLQGGVGFRGYYLKKNYDISIKNYVAMTTFQYVAVFGISGLLIVLGLAVVNQGIIVLSFVATSIFLTLLLFLANSIRPELFNGIKSRFIQALKISNLKNIFIIILIAILQLCGSGLAYYIGLESIGADVTLGALLIYTGVSQFSILIAITPGAVGFREGLLLLVSSQMGLNTQDIVLAATIDRLVFFITLAIITPFAAVNRKSFRKLEKQKIY
jgi:uncharacterized membrane protein YbhN (UPF0104 family)